MPVKRCVKIRARVASQLVRRNLKGRARSVLRVFSPVFVREEDVKLRNGKSGIRGHSRLKPVPEIDDHGTKSMPQTRQRQDRVGQCSVKLNMVWPRIED